MINTICWILIAFLFVLNAVISALWYKDIKNCKKLIEINKNYKEVLVGFIKSNDQHKCSINPTDIEMLKKLLPIIDDGYTKMLNQHAKLLECWKNIEEKYSLCYEQYDKINTDLEELERLINERTHDIMAIFPIHCPQCNVPDEEFQNERFGIQKDQINFEELNEPILTGNILDEDWDTLKEEYKQEILEAGCVDADRLGEMILDSRKKDSIEEES